MGYRPSLQPSWGAPMHWDGSQPPLCALFWCNGAAGDRLQRMVPW